MRGPQRALRAVLIAVVVSLAATALTPIQSGAATSSIGNVVFSQPGKVRLITGELTTVSGTASADMVGKAVGVQLKVSGQWTTVSQSSVKSNRTFSMSVRVAGPGQVSYRVVSWTGSRWLQVERNFTTWKWYSLVDLPIVDDDGCPSIEPITNVTVGGRDYGRQIGTSVCWGFADDPTWADFNLSYKCSVFSTEMGLRDDSASGTRAIFDVQVDGVAIEGARRTVFLGQKSSYSTTITGSFRLRVMNEMNLQRGRGYAAWPNAKVLCSGKP